MTHQENRTLTLVLARLRSLASNDRRLYAGDPIGDGPRIYLDTWVIPYIEAVAVPSNNRSGDQRYLLAVANKEVT